MKLEIVVGHNSASQGAVASVNAMSSNFLRTPSSFPAQPGAPEKEHDN